MVDTSVKFAGLELANPFILSAQAPLQPWTPEKLARIMKKLVDAGAAMVLTGHTCETANRPDSAKPIARVIPAESKPPFSKLGFFLICRTRDSLSYCNETIKLIEILKKRVKVPIGANISGRGADEESWARLAMKCEEAGADLIELNTSCPSPANVQTNVEQALRGELAAKSVGALLGQIATLTERVTRAVTHSVSVPVVTKMTPEVGFPHLISIAQGIRNADAKGVTVINAPISVAPPDIYNEGRPSFPLVDKYSFGGAYGPWDRFITYKFVASIAMYVPELDIAAVGGNVDPENQIEFMMLGAKAVQLSSGFLWRGYGVIRRNIEFMRRYMEEQGYERPSDFVGLGLKHIVSSEDINFTPAVSKIIRERCTNCGQCAQTLCLATSLKEGVCRVDVSSCSGCGLCLVSCPENARKLVPREV